MELGSLLLSAPPPSLLSGPTLLHENGLVLTSRFGKLRGVHPWEDVAELRYDVTMRIHHDRSAGSVVTRRTRHLAFGFGAGPAAGSGDPVRVELPEDAVRTLASDFFGGGVRPAAVSPVEDAVEHVRRRVADAQLPGVRERIDAGETVAFGAVSVTADELRHEGEALPWRRISWLGFLHRYSSRPPRDAGGWARISWDLDEKWVDVPAADVPNLQTLERLYDTRPREPGDPHPVTGDYEPPGGEHAVGTLYLRCPACGAVTAGGRSLEYRVGADGDYVWPVTYECGCGHTGDLARSDVLPRDARWTCTRPGCDTVFAVPAGATSVTCPVCRSGYDTGE